MRSRTGGLVRARHVHSGQPPVQLPRQNLRSPITSWVQRHLPYLADGQAEVAGLVQALLVVASHPLPVIKCASLRSLNYRKNDAVNPCLVFASRDIPEEPPFFCVFRCLSWFQVLKWPKGLQL